MFRLIKIRFKCLIFLFLFALLAAKSAQAAHDESLWIVTCRECHDAINGSLYQSCDISEKACRDRYTASHQECATCLSNILNPIHHESYDNEFYLLCRNEIETQQLGCQYYCRVSGFTNGVCSRADLPFSGCRCSNVDSFGKVYNVLLGHEGPVYALSALSGVSYANLASGSGDNSIKLWNTDKFRSRALLNLTGHTAAVNSLVQLKNGYLVSGSDDNRIIVWDVSSKDGARKVRELNAHTSWITALDVLKNGNLISASNDKTIKIWNSNGDFSLVANLVKHNDHVLKLVVLNNGNFFSVSPTESIYWNGQTYEPITRMPKSKDDSFANSLHAIGASSLLYGSRTLMSIDVWDNQIDFDKAYGWLKKSYALTTFGNNMVAHATVTRNLQELRTNLNMTIKVFPQSNIKQIQYFKGIHDDEVISLATLSDGKLVSGSFDSKIVVWGSKN